MCLSLIQSLVGLQTAEGRKMWLLRWLVRRCLCTACKNQTWRASQRGVKRHAFKWKCVCLSVCISFMQSSCLERFWLGLQGGIFPSCCFPAKNHLQMLVAPKVFAANSQFGGKQLALIFGRRTAWGERIGLPILPCHGSLPGSYVLWQKEAFPIESEERSWFNSIV